MLIGSQKHLCSGWLLTAFCVVGCAAFGAATARAADAAGKSTSARPAIDATDKAAILAAMPQEVAVVGTINDIKDNDGVAMIHFVGTDESQFYAVVLKRNREAVEKVHGEGLKSLAGKHATITGKIVEYRGKPQIIISAPEQVAVLNESNSQPSGLSTKPDSKPVAIDATDKAAVLGAMPQEVTVAGTISDIKDNDGVVMINFTGTDKSQFYAVVLKRNREAVEKVHGEGLKSLEGKHVKVTGRIVEYREKPEIIVSLPEQIALADK